MYLDHNPYEYNYITTNKMNGNGPYEKLVYSFKNREGKKFMVHVDIFRINDSPRRMYVLKFFLNKHKRMGDKKYKQILNIPDSRTIFKTCVQIMLDRWKNDKEACFAVHGICSKEDLTITTKNDTYDRKNSTSRRFNIYLHLTARYFNIKQFHIAAREELNSIIIFANNHNFDSVCRSIEKDVQNAYPNCMEMLRLHPDKTNMVYEAKSLS